MLNLFIDSANLEQSFDRIARQLFNEYVFSIGQENYQLTEIEFYYNNNQKGSKDNFAHVHDEKHRNGTWRLHGAGLDIVLKKEGVYYGGILIRGVQKLDRELKPMLDEIIDGPWNTANVCIRQLGEVTNTERFKLTKLEINRTRAFVKSPRVGLFLKNEEDLEYICKPWRYTSTPICTKNYRYLIFLQLCIDTTRTDAEKNKIIEQLKLSQNARANYLQYFATGKKMETEAFVRIKRTVENTCQLFGNYIKNNSNL